mmetsp:Transcript_2998/g.7134  ORF Transcript_2998/g.7134 Transcript_2998/m.7134 type:complete len:239 (-) Transcript_2998:33-749(-)
MADAPRAAQGRPVCVREGERGRGHPHAREGPVEGRGGPDAAARRRALAKGAHPAAEPHRALGGRHPCGCRNPDRRRSALRAGRDPGGGLGARGHFHPPKGERGGADRRFGSPDRTGAGPTRGHRCVRCRGRVMRSQSIAARPQMDGARWMGQLRLPGRCGPLRRANRGRTCRSDETAAQGQRWTARPAPAARRGGTPALSAVWECCCRGGVASMTSPPPRLPVARPLALPRRRSGSWT